MTRTTSPADTELALIAIRQARPDVAVHVVENGEEALVFLHRGEGHADAARPDLILLDLNLPGRNGIEIAAILKADRDLLAIPIIMFSNSNTESDVRAAYENGANAYLAKPMEYADIKQALSVLLYFWLGSGPAYRRRHRRLERRRGRAPSEPRPAPRGERLGHRQTAA